VIGIILTGIFCGVMIGVVAMLAVFAAFIPTHEEADNGGEEIDDKLLR
jgi:hypothetical protein